MDLKILKGMTLDDLLDMDYTKLKEDEIAYVEKRLVKIANRRLNTLRKKGLISEAKITAKERKGISGYKPPKTRTRVTRGGKVVPINVRNKRVKSANKVREFLKKETTTVRGIKKREDIYLNNINKTLSESFGRSVKLDKRRLKRVGKLMKKAEELYKLGDVNKKFSGSPYILQTIVDIVKSREYIRNDEAEQIINEAVQNGYESGQRMMSQLLNEDEDGIDIDFLTDDDIF